MKLLNKYLISVAAISMVACSSMDVEYSEAVEENFPDDFDHAVYMQLHPELVSLQVRDYVNTYNAEAKTKLTPEQISADVDSFHANLDQIHQIYADPNLGGFSEAQWEAIWLPVESEKTTCGNKFTVLNLQQIVAGEGDAVDTVKIKLLDPITITPEGATSPDSIVSVKGAVDSAGTLKEYTMGDSIWVMSGKNMGTSVVDSATCVTKVDTIPSTGIPTVTKNYLEKFNFVDTKDDLTRLKKIPLDTMAFSIQYILFGRDNGWAYRKCKEDEASNPAITETYPVTKLYCVDEAGVVREIK